MADQNIEDFTVVAPNVAHHVLVTGGTGTPIEGQRPVSGLVTSPRAWSEIVVTLPSPRGAYEHEEVVVVSGLTGSVAPSGMLAPAADDDENDPETLSLSTLVAIAATDALTVRMTFTEPTSGPVKLLWRL